MSAPIASSSSLALILWLQNCDSGEPWQLLFSAFGLSGLVHFPGGWSVVWSGNRHSWVKGQNPVGWEAFFPHSCVCHPTSQKGWNGGRAALTVKIQAFPGRMMKKNNNNTEGHLAYCLFKQLLRVLELLLTKAVSKQKLVPKWLKSTPLVVAL